jgi:hypothetical protein
MKTLEEVYLRLNAIKKQVDDNKEETFDNKALFKYLYNSILDLIDELEFIKESDELFDDEAEFIKDNNIDATKKEDNDTWDDIMDDLIDE